MAKKTFDITKIMGMHSQIDQVEKILMISVYDLDPHPQNNYSMTDIELLAAQIETQGAVKEPIVVKKSSINGRYIVISGHRRREAVLRLLKEHSDIITSPSVPVIVRSFNSEKEEIYAIAAANSQREKTLEDKENELEMMRPYIHQEYTELKKEGKKLGKFREYFAKKMGLSPSDIQRIESMKNLNPTLRNEINEKKFTMTAASAIANLPQSAQKEIYNEAKDRFGKVTCKAINEIKKEQGTIDNVENLKDLEDKGQLRLDQSENIEVNFKIDDGDSDVALSEDKLASDNLLTDKDIFNQAIDKETAYIKSRLKYLMSLYEIEEKDGLSSVELSIIHEQISIVQKIIHELESDKVNS